MPDRPRIELDGTVLGTRDPRALADFYRRLLGWDVVEDDPSWVVLRGPGAATLLSFQLETEHVPPVWPARPGDQQMMLHLDLRVANLAEATSYAQECGARVADFQPQEDVRVCLDPDGHPFCLFVPRD